MGYSDRDLPALRNFAASRTTAMDRQYHAKSVDAGQHPAQTLNEQQYQSNKTSMPGQVITAPIVVPADATRFGTCDAVLDGVADQAAQLYRQMNERESEFTAAGLESQRNAIRQSEVAQLISIARQEAAQRVQELLDEAEQAKAQAITPPAADTRDIAIHEQLWRKLKPGFDKLDSAAVTNAFAQKIRDSDPLTRSVLAAEYVDYVNSRTDSDGVPAVLDAVLAQADDKYRATLDRYNRGVQAKQLIDFKADKVQRFVDTGEIGAPLIGSDVLSRYDPDRVTQTAQ
jgi:hypothetical protein